MQVQAINSMHTVYSKNFPSAVKTKTQNSNVSFKSIYLDGEIIMNASKSQLRGYAEMLRNLPDSAIKELSSAYGFLHKKHKVSRDAYNRITGAIREVQDEVDTLRESNSPGAKKRLYELYDAAEKGNREYYKESESSDVELYQDTIDGIAEDMRSHI